MDRPSGIVVGGRYADHMRGFPNPFTVVLNVLPDEDEFCDGEAGVRVYYDHGGPNAMDALPNSSAILRTCSPLPDEHPALATMHEVNRAIDWLTDTAARLHAALKLNSSPIRVQGQPWRDAHIRWQLIRRESGRLKDRATRGLLSSLALLVRDLHIAYAGSGAKEMDPDLLTLGRACADAYAYLWAEAQEQDILARIRAATERAGSPSHCPPGLPSGLNGATLHDTDRPALARLLAKGLVIRHAPADPTDAGGHAGCPRYARTVP